jgi:hypothetical protein
MVRGIPNRSVRLLSSLTLVVAVAISGCGDSKEPAAPTLTTLSISSSSPEPTTPDETEPTTEKTKPTTTNQAEPSTAEAGDLNSATAEAICRTIYASRGSAPAASSRDMDDEMALFETWHAGLLQKAITQLGTSAELDDLVGAMKEMRTLNLRAASIYAQHPVFSDELARIEQRQTALADLVKAVAAEAGAPMCAAVVVLP